MPRSRWWKSKASSGKLKRGFLSILSWSAGKRSHGFQTMLILNFHRLTTRSLAAPQVESPSTSSPRASFTPLHEIQISLAENWRWNPLLDTEIPFPRSRYFVIGGIEFSNGSRSVIWKGAKNIPLFFSLYSPTISRGRDSFVYACWSFFRRRSRKTRSSTFSLRNYFIFF